MQPTNGKRNRSIRLLIVDDSPDMVRNVQKLLHFESDIQVVGSASNAEDAFSAVTDLHPDVVLMDINLRGKYDGLQATQLITHRWQACVVMMSVQREPEYITHAMTLGARGYLTKPFTGEQLADTIRTAYKNDLAIKEAARRAAMSEVVNLDPRQYGDGYGLQSHGPRSLRKIIAVYSPKGGCGRSVIAANLAVMLRRGTGRRVVLVDANLSSGDAHILLNMIPSSSIEDLRETVGTLEDEQLQGMVAYQEETGVGLVRAPLSIEASEHFTADAMKAILVELSDHFDYVVVDTDTTYSHYTLTTLETASIVLLITTLEVTAVNQVSQFFEIADRLDNVIPKIQLVCNRVDTMYGIQPRHVEARFSRRLLAMIPEDPRVVVASVNRGVPFVVSQRNAQVSKAVEKLAERTVKILAESSDDGTRGRR
jgi:pilus assembly protein CpaE